MIKSGLKGSRLRSRFGRRYRALPPQSHQVHVKEEADQAQPRQAICQGSRKNVIGREGTLQE